MLLPILPEPYIEVIFSPVVESKPIAVEILLDSFLLVSVNPLQNVEPIPASILKVAKGVFYVGPVLAHNYLLPKAVEVIVFEFTNVVILDSLSLRVKIN